MTAQSLQENGQLGIWTLGDFSLLASTMTIIGEELCESADLRSGQKILDVATGSGNIALAAARRFCDVIGVDLVPGLLERAKERAAAERLGIALCEGNADKLPFLDASFDVVMYTFGHPYASHHRVSELLRVCRPGGKIATVDWSPDSPIRILIATARGNSPSVGRKVPLHGIRAELESFYGNRISSLQLKRRTFVFRYRSPQHWIDFFRSHFGPMIQIFQSLDSEAREMAVGNLVAVLGRLNQSGDETLVIPCDYLEVVATKSNCCSA
jgi:ubiquinone/menaquinone biosynthesis C-methylase UbiE